MLLADSQLQSRQLAIFVTRFMNHVDRCQRMMNRTEPLALGSVCADTSRHRKIKTPTSHVPSLRLSEPKVTEGKVVLGVAHILASFNFLAYIIDLSSHGGIDVNANLDESSPCIPVLAV
ncbi:hypothetical protein BKA70DRAFT_1425592 [Coprinopsis sp. MPI-PUGE-AT-0042]|nr:hypothetical protein BKA70DRAFT_1425592 [Coprinopsis sp. MPI-PUGE-AT-0042]